MNSSASRLQSRGPVQEAALYIARPADRQVEDALRSGGMCVVLGPPGSGKSSLRVRVGRSLAKDGVPGAHLPLGKLPSATPAAFCLGLMQGLGRALGLPPLSAFFQRYAEQYGDTPPAERLQMFFRELVLGSIAGPVALFFDDLDALNIPCAEALCGALYGIYAEEAGAEPPAPRLGVCLTSTTDPDELVLPLPPSVRRIYLSAFTRQELDAFAPALAPLCLERPPPEGDGEAPQLVSAAALLDAVHDWTGGQPALTQHLCQQLLVRRDQAESADRLVEKLIEKLFRVSEVGDDPVLAAMEKRLIGDRRASALLALWRRIWRGEAVSADPTDASQRTLWLCGLSTCPESAFSDESRRLRPAGRIVARIFDDEWARSQEARQLLRAAVGGGEGEAAKLRGTALKTAQTWAVRHIEALSAAETRALILGLEAARQDAEARHQSSASALQRETRERAELRTQWSREREELTATAASAKRRALALALLASLLLLLSLYLGYRELHRRKSSSPACQMSPAPSVMKRSPGWIWRATAAATSPRSGTCSHAGCPAARILSTSNAAETPAIGSSPAA